MEIAFSILHSPFSILISHFSILQMPLGTLLLGLAILAVVVAIIALPLFDRKTPFKRQPSQREALENERRDVVRAIRELDFDYRTGKLNEDDYKRLRETQVQRGADILRQLDQLNEAADSRRDADAEIEQRVAAIRQQPSTRETDAVVQDGQATSLACPACGSRVSAADRFCPQCGHALAKVEEQHAS
jgi:rubrerythrin